MDKFLLEKVMSEKNKTQTISYTIYFIKNNNYNLGGHRTKENK